MGDQTLNQITQHFQGLWVEEKLQGVHVHEQFQGPRVHEGFQRLGVRVFASLVYLNCFKDM